MLQVHAKPLGTSHAPSAGAQGTAKPTWGPKV